MYTRTQTHVQIWVQVHIIIHLTSTNFCSSFRHKLGVFPLSTSLPLHPAQQIAFSQLDAIYTVYGLVISQASQSTTCTCNYKTTYFRSKEIKIILIISSALCSWWLSAAFWSILIQRLLYTRPTKYKCEHGWCMGSIANCAAITWLYIGNRWQFAETITASW